MLGTIIPLTEAGNIATGGSSAPIGIVPINHNRPHQVEQAETCCSGDRGGCCDCRCNCPGCVCRMNRHEEDANRNNYGGQGGPFNRAMPVHATDRAADDYGSLISAGSFDSYRRPRHCSEAPAPITSALNDENLRQVNSLPDHLRERHRRLLDFLEVDLHEVDNFPDRAFLSPDDEEALDESMEIDGEVLDTSMQNEDHTPSGARSMLSSQYERSFPRSSVANSIILTGTGSVFNPFISLAVVNHPQYMSSVTLRRQF